MSFLKIFPRPKSRESVKIMNKGSFIPLDSLELDCSLSAVAQNISLNCKSCTSVRPNRPSSPMDYDRQLESGHLYSGFVGVISKGTFLIHQLDIDYGTTQSQPVSYKLLRQIEITNSKGGLNVLDHPTLQLGKWIRLRKHKRNATVLVLISSIGIHIYSEDGSVLLCNLEYQEFTPSVVCRNVGATTCQIFAGNGQGEVHVFDFHGDIVKFRRTDKVSSEPISQLVCSNNCLLTTGSPSGTIRVWKIKDCKAIKVCCFKTPIEECVTGLGIWEGCIIATYGSGTFRVFDLQSRTIIARVAAHARWIVAMDLLPSKGHLLTVGEDDVALVWKLNFEPTSTISHSQGSGRNIGESIKNIKHKIKNIHHHQSSRYKRDNSKICIHLDSTIRVENSLLVGGRFLPCNGNIVALANYGARELYLYSRMEESRGGSDGDLNTVQTE